MTLITETMEPDTRERILVVAERLFRELGYQKTTVGDIAKALHMSPANVYRFFDSKKAIHEGVARILMGEVEVAAQAIMAKPGPATPRLRELLSTIHRMNSERFVGDSKLHEMVEIAMEESWEVCVAHTVVESIAGVVAQGVASGEFEAQDVPLTALCICQGMMGYFHPQMIAQAVNKPKPHAPIEQMIDFLLVGLATRKHS
jgi:AcrR family transcriptional regulator